VIVDVPLEGLVGAFADVDAAECPVEVFGDVGSLHTLSAWLSARLDIRAAPDSRRPTEQRALPINDYLRKLLGGRGITRSSGESRLRPQRGLRHNACDYD